MKQLNINFSIPIGTFLKLGYRAIGTSDPWVFVNNQIAYNQTPFVLSVPTGVTYEIYTATICGSCPDGVSNVVVAYEVELPS